MKKIFFWCRNVACAGLHTEVGKMIILSLIINMIIECLNHRNLWGLAELFANPVVFLYNTSIIFLTLCIGFFTTRKVFVYVMISAIWITLAVINFVVLSARKTPFTAMDIYLIKDAVKVLPVYLNVFQIILIVIGIIAGIAGLVFLWIKGPKVIIAQTLKRRIIFSSVKTVIAGAVVTALTVILIPAGVLGRNFGNLGIAYRHYGFVYCFSCSVVGRGISKSGEYSQEYINNIKNNIENEQTDNGVVNSQEAPNIIFLQLESFFNPDRVKKVKFSQDVLPNMKRLSSEYSAGYISVPCFGAGTANTEFEVQTGINLDDFGPGEYPYKTVLQSAICESAAYDLKNLGYSTHALHNNDGTFYNRNKVFSHLGYDTFTSIEYMSDIEYNPIGWAKDSILTGEIAKILDSTEGSDYIYTISVQGHGDYPSTPMEGYTPEIKVTNFPVAEQQASFEYYVNQIHEMDNFIGELIQSLSERDEETVLVLYGDHLPTFDFTDEMLTNGDKFQTQYVIWSNFDMDRQEKNIQAYQLSAYVMQRLGISEGYIMKYHQSKQELPEDEYLKNLKILEYDILYGKKEIYGGETPYEATNLKMGIDDIEITDVYNYNDTVFIEGSSFNDYSCVLINGKEYTTEKVSDRLLRVNGINVKKDDVVVVAQKGDDKVELSRTTFTVKQQSKKNAQQQ